MCENSLVGIASWGLECGGLTPGVFAKVDHFMPWISKQIQNYEQKMANESLKIENLTVLPSKTLE